MSNKINKFFDLEPAGKDSGHYLCENGLQIARYSSLAAAEAARQEFMMDEVARLERKLDQQGIER